MANPGALVRASGLDCFSVDGGADGLPRVGAAAHSARLTFLLCGIGVAGGSDASESHSSSSAGALGALVLAGLGACAVAAPPTSLL